MKLLLGFLSLFGLSLFYPSFVLAHETGETHTESPASIDPVVAVIIVVVIAIGVFLVWKFVLKSKETPPAKPN